MQHRPLLLWTAAFIAGLTAATITAWALWALGLIGLIGLALIGLSGRHGSRLAIGIVLTGMAAGALRLAAFLSVPPTDIAHCVDQPGSMTVIGTVVSDPELRQGGQITLFLQADRVQTWNSDRVTTGEVYVTLSQYAHLRDTDLDYGERVSLTGTLEVPLGATNPGGFSWHDYLARRGIGCQLHIKRPGAVVLLGQSSLNPYVRFAWTVRRRVLAAVRQALPSTRAAALSGMLLGQRTDLPPQIMSDFVNTGTVHLLASAGLHVGIVIWWLMKLFERLTLPRKVSILLLIVLLWLYALMAGGRPSVTRAVLMATLYFGAILFEREPDLPTSLAAAALAILLLQPTALVESGFQLSFLTVLTLAVTMPLWQAFWEPRLEKIFSRPWARKSAGTVLEMLGLSVLAQVGSAPVVALDYNEVSLTGFPANALTVPLLFLIIPLGFGGALLSCLWPPLGTIFLRGAAFGVQCVISIVRTLGEHSWAYHAVSTPSWLALLLYYATLLYTVWIWRSRNNPNSQPAASHP